MITKKPIQPYGMLCYAQLNTPFTLKGTGVKQMEIYQITDTQDSEAHISTHMWKYRHAAEKQVQRMMMNHVREMMKKVQKMTGTVRGANVQQFNSVVESVATPRFVIKTIKIKTEW